MNTTEDPPKVELSQAMKDLLEQQIAQLTCTASIALQQIVLSAAERISREAREVAFPPLDRTK